MPVTLKRVLLCLALLAAVLLPVATCTRPPMEWLDLKDGQTVWGAVPLKLRVSSGARNVSLYVSYRVAPSDPSLADQFLVPEKDGSVYSADWATQELRNGTCYVYASAQFGSERMGAQVAVNVENESRAELIPTSVVKLTPGNDPAPPQLASAFRSLWEDPVPMPGPVNTAGAEDSPFITPDGDTFYFFFTGDVNKDVQIQAQDPWTGIYWTKKVNGEWQEPQRLFLQYWDKIGLDGDPMQRGDTLWFGSVREGNYRGVDLWTAKLVDGRWTNWSNAGELFNKTYQIGELHVSADGDEVYCGSTRPGGRGQSDIWVTRKVGGQWQPPQNVAAVNTEASEGQPFLSEDGNELWFTRLTPGPSVWRSLKVNGHWQPPEEVLSNLAGEPTLDAAGNLYFVHHRWDNALNRVSEADIYVCWRKAAQ